MELLVPDLMTSHNLGIPTQSGVLLQAYGNDFSLSNPEEAWLQSDSHLQKLQLAG